jgi:hypothetical protein
LNEEPGLRGGQTAKLFWLSGPLGSAAPTIATTAPVRASMETRAPWLTCRQRWSLSWLIIACSAITCSGTLRVVSTRRPPPSSTFCPYLAATWSMTQYVNPGAP